MTLKGRKQSVTSQARVDQILNKRRTEKAREKHLTLAKLKHKKVLDLMVGKGGKIKSIRQAGKEAGYSDAYIESGKLQKTDAWNELLEIHLSDAELTRHHNLLLNAQRIGHQTFGMGVKDEEIIEVVESFGFPVMKVLFVQGLGKVAYYSIPDHIAKKYALEMAYKLKQKYGDITIQHKFGEQSDEDLEQELAGVITEVSEGLGNLKRTAKKKGK